MLKITFVALAVVCVAAAQTHVQSASSSTGGTTLAYASNVTANNLGFVTLGCFNATFPTVSVSDSTAGAWTAGPFLDESANSTIHLWTFYKVFPSSQASTVTVNWGTCSGVQRLIIAEYSGLIAISPLDQSQSQNNSLGDSTGLFSSGTITPANNTQLIVGIASNGNTVTTIAANTGWTQRQAVPAGSSNFLSLIDQNLGTAAAVNADWDSGLEQFYQTAIMSFRTVAPSTKRRVVVVH